MVAAGSNLAVTFIVAGGLGAATTGHFLQVVALVMILAMLAQLGADLGVQRFLPLCDPSTGPGEATVIFRIAFLPVILAAAAMSAAILLGAKPLADLLSASMHSDEIQGALGAAALVLPAVVASTFFVSASQAGGRMGPAVAADKLARPLFQVILMFVFLDRGLAGLVLAWGVPYAASAGILSIHTRRAVGRSAGPSRQWLAPFWKFAAPRGLAAGCQILLLWIDVILLGALRSSEEAGAYGLAGRYLVIGTLVVTAFVQAATPALSRRLRASDSEDAANLFRLTTARCISATWPVYISLGILAYPILTAFGSAFSGGAVALTILAAALLFDVAVGPVDILLLMAGRSGQSLVAWVAAIVLNLSMNVIMIPRWGIPGAAIAWAMAILLRNALGLYFVRRALRISPSSRTSLVAMVRAVVVFVPASSLLLVLSDSMTVIVAGLGLAGACYWWVGGLRTIFSEATSQAPASLIKS